MAGVVRWFSSAKGYGFISPETPGEDIFVHQTSIEAEGFRSLRPGETVEFAVEVGEDGKHKAIKVTGPGGSAPQGATRRPPYGARAPYGGGRGPFIDYGGFGYGFGYGYPPMPGRGRAGRPPMMPGRGREQFEMYGYGYDAGRGGGRGFERRPPPGTPGVSSGLQVVVHNLPWDCTWQQLKDAFTDCGAIERADVVKDSRGNSRGFGVVRFGSAELAQQAVEKMNNKEVGGRVVTVRIDRYA